MYNKRTAKVVDQPKRSPMSVPRIPSECFMGLPGATLHQYTASGTSKPKAFNKEQNQTGIQELYLVYDRLIHGMARPARLVAATGTAVAISFGELPPAGALCSLPELLVLVAQASPPPKMPSDRTVRTNIKL